MKYKKLKVIFWKKVLKIKNEIVILKNNIIQKKVSISIKILSKSNNKY